MDFKIPEKYYRNLEVALYFRYGTAGFRTKAKYLDSCMYRMGILSVFCSRYYNGKAIGLMITASHNPQEDNGIKMIDPQGEMIDASWEKIAEIIANCDEKDFEETLKRELLSKNINIGKESPSLVFISKDTRPSGSRLSAAVIDGVTCVKGGFKFLDLLTTPQLHFLVEKYNTSPDVLPTEKSYFDKLSTSYVELMKMCVYSDEDDLDNKLYVDAANGVGAPKLKELGEAIGDSRYLSVKIINDASSPDARINDCCGADYVKSNQCFPFGFDLENGELVGKKCVTFDGDADRIMYFYCRKDLTFRLLDGDKIASLIALFLKDLIDTCDLKDVLSMAVIQTAYANGKSSRYIHENLKLNVVVTPTGVKNLHEKAKLFDIGIYFEANGHGTVLYSQKTMDILNDLSTDETCLPEKRNAASIFLLFVKLTNQIIGDALCDMLLVETILKYKRWSIEAWDCMYDNSPYQLLSVTDTVNKPFYLSEDETKCLVPRKLQNEIDKIVRLSYDPDARAFVRPSGTEAIIRIYAEAITKSLANEIAFKISEVVKNLKESDFIIN